MGCRGVVQLFNAISKAQAARRQADAAGAKQRDAVKSTKAALLGALKPEAKEPGMLLVDFWSMLGCLPVPHDSFETAHAVREMEPVDYHAFVCKNSRNEGCM